MAKSFREIGKKAEDLIEQGNKADKRLNSCQGRVSSASSRVASARSQLAAARETDEEGNPKGDVSRATAELSMAQNELAASQRALSSAKAEAARIRQQKSAHVQEIEKHNSIERSNIEKLKRLRSMAFAADSTALTAGMAERLNEAEKSRVALLKSMGISAAADYVSVGGAGGMDSSWSGIGISSLDLSGQAASYKGGSGEGTVSSSGIAAPVGGGLRSTDFNSRPDAAAKPLFGFHIPGRKSENSSAPTIDFNGLTLNRTENGSYFVEGDNYDRFSHFWNHSDQYSYADSDYITMVHSWDIEGINLNQNDAADRHLFWNRGASYAEDSETYFGRIAKYIPEVKARLDSGESIDSIRSNPDLAACYDNYFDTPIKVYKIDDYYYFEGSGGRHRCMAAKKFGIDMPVKVIGTYTSDIKSLSNVQDFQALSLYMGAKYSIRLAPPVEHLEFGTVKEALTGVESVISEYPEVGTLLREAITTDKGEMEMGMVMCCTGDTLKFNPIYFSDPDTLKEMCRRLSASHDWVPNSSPQSCGVHEAGHGVEWAIIMANPQYSTDDQRRYAWDQFIEANKIVKEACRRVRQTPYGSGKTNGDLITSISMYAADNSSETMAEAFADVYANGNNANPLSKEIKHCTELLMKRYKP